MPEDPALQEALAALELLRLQARVPRELPEEQETEGPHEVGGVEGDIYRSTTFASLNVDCKDPKMLPAFEELVKYSTFATALASCRKESQTRGLSHHDAKKLGFLFYVALCEAGVSSLKSISCCHSNTF